MAKRSAYIPGSIVPALWLGLFCFCDRHVTTTFYYIPAPICRPGGGQYGGNAGVFFGYLKSGKRRKRRLFPTFPFVQKVGKNKHHVPLCAGPLGLGFSEVFHLKGHGRGNNAGAGDVSKC